MSVAICGIGVMTPVGLHAVQTFASVRAGICRFAESDFIGSHHLPIVMSLLPDDSYRVQRILRSGSAASLVGGRSSEGSYRRK